LLIHEGTSLGELRRLAKREDEQLHRKEAAMDESSKQSSSAAQGESAE
jgi:hypothetical protein